MQSCMTEPAIKLADVSTISHTAHVESYIGIKENNNLYVNICDLYHAHMCTLGIITSLSLI